LKVQKIPTNTPTPTLHPLLMTATALQKQILALTPTITPTLTVTPTMTPTDRAIIDAVIPDYLSTRYAGIPTGTTTAPDYPVAYPYLGNPNAPIKIEQISNYSCSHCRDFYDSTIVEILDEIRAGRVQYVFIPVVFTVAFDPTNGTKAAICALRQEKFWQMHDILFDWQDRYGTGAADMDRLRAAARKLGLDMAAFDTCMVSSETRQYIDVTLDYAHKRGMTATPLVFVNGKQIQPTLPDELPLTLDDLRATIEAAPTLTPKATSTATATPTRTNTTTPTRTSTATAVPSRTPTPADIILMEDAPVGLKAGR
jgi:protein-disulfide isomerase